MTPSLKVCFLPAILMLSSFSTYAAVIPNSSDPTTFLGPTAKVTYTSTFNDDTAYSFAGELGRKNYRAGATFGWQIDLNQRAKLGAEYLWQDLGYAFFSGSSNQWTSQGAVGGEYEYLLPYNYYPWIGLTGYYAHSPNKSLGTITGSFTNAAGVKETFVNTRHIAGSDAYGINPEITISPMLGTMASLILNYDHVDYDKTPPPNRGAYGIGGTARLNQMLTPDINIGLLASVRQPFNYYDINMTVMNLPFLGCIAIGLDAAYTAGKNTLPNSYNVSLTGSYTFDRSGDVPQIPQPVRFNDVTGESTEVPHDTIASETARPPVYLPEVLAIPNSGVLLAP